VDFFSKEVHPTCVCCKKGRQNKLASFQIRFLSYYFVAPPSPSLADEVLYPREFSALRNFRAERFLCARWDSEWQILSAFCVCSKAYLERSFSQNKLRKDYGEQKSYCQPLFTRETNKNSPATKMDKILIFNTFLLCSNRQK
jgi:hypothetical protein